MPATELVETSDPKLMGFGLLSIRLVLFLSISKVINTSSTSFI
jgi:hypothetical protein